MHDTASQSTDSTPEQVFATRALPGDALSALALDTRTRLEVWPGRAAPSPAELRAALATARGLLCLLSDRIDADLLAAAPGLRAISSYSVGLDHVDLTAATARGIPVGHTPGVLTETTADLAFGLLLAAARRLPEGDRVVRSGAWAAEPGWSPDFLLGVDVHGRTLGIVGLGQIGRAVARRAAGFGMRVLGWSRSGRAVPGVEPASLERLLVESDFVSVHVALTAETRGRIGVAELAAMKPDAVLVNTARGGIVDEAALADALRTGGIRAAALDVFEHEPLAADHPLLELPNLVLAPHVGSATEATRRAMAELAVANLRAGLRGEPMPCCANPEVYRR